MEKEKRGGWNKTFVENLQSLLQNIRQFTPGKKKISMGTSETAEGGDAWKRLEEE